MYAVVGPAGSKATCSGCSQYVDCARCERSTCGDTKCLGCYNKALVPGKKISGGPIIPDEAED